jgi:hypothetical protein|tara:strand:+ start:401 stop:562 length:162 start_codon:yes stop_codon:yes gene_type:complete
MNICNITIPNPIHPGDLGTVVLRVAVPPVTIEEDVGSRVWHLAFHLLGRDRGR